MRGDRFRWEFTSVSDALSGASRNLCNPDHLISIAQVVPTDHKGASRRPKNRGVSLQKHNNPLLTADRQET